jgi:branched-chain amino acid transport system ATP-binding protein
VSSAPDIPVLQVQGVSKAFGGVLANRDVSLEIARDEVHGLIGPNGAGKTTLISMLAGEQRPDQGRILLDGRDVTHASAPERAQLGIRRSFQITSVFSELTVIANAVLACQAIRGGTFRFWRPVRADAELYGQARATLAQVGIERLADRIAASLSHGERRQLELAMALVGRPRILLLDEPFAGMGPDETTEMVERLRVLKGHQAMLVIEHDLDALFTLADRLTVLVMGVPIASGDTETIRRDEKVRAAYFGTRAAA